MRRYHDIGIAHCEKSVTGDENVLNKKVCNTLTLNRVGNTLEGHLKIIFYNQNLLFVSF